MRRDDSPDLGTVRGFLHALPDGRLLESLRAGRTAVERVNARMKIFWGADDGNVTGAERFHAQVGVVMRVHAGLATLLAACPRGKARSVRRV